MENYFKILNDINVNDKTEKKKDLTYLSWAWAWAELKKLFPDSTYTVYENSEGWCYFTDGRTCWVKTGVTVKGIEHIEYLPVMDFRNASIPADKVTSFDVNKAIQRSLTKAVARHGLGLYIYAGEDLPEEDAKVAEEKKKAEPKKESPKMITDEQKKEISELFDDNLMPVMLNYCKNKFKANSIADLTEAQAKEIIEHRKKTIKEQEEAKNESDSANK